jgi:hypothetical protein
MNRRTGTTLVEVLIAIFVMGIGMLALLTLFPLGALNMAQAIKDSRAAHSSANAAAIAEAFAIRGDTILTDPTTGAFINPGSFTSLANIPGGYDGPSFAVLVDPIGVYSGSPSWVTGVVRQFSGAVGAVPRRSPSFIPATPQLARNQAILQSFTLLDELRFSESGSGLPDVSTGEIQRESVYSWAYLVRRPRLSVPSVVDLSIVVYNQRAFFVAPNEDWFYAVFDNSRNVVTVVLQTGQTPSIRPGSWILDATVEVDPQNPATVRKPHGFFYRVEEVTETTFNNQPALELSVASPFREFPLPKPPQPYLPSPGMVFYMDGVVEVIEKGPGWLP